MNYESMTRSELLKVLKTLSPMKYIFYKNSEKDKIIRTIKVSRGEKL